MGLSQTLDTHVPPLEEGSDGVFFSDVYGDCKHSFWIQRNDSFVCRSVRNNINSMRPHVTGHNMSQSQRNKISRSEMSH